MRALSAAILGISLTACGGSPTSPMALTHIEVRVGDLMNAKLGLPVPAPLGLTGTLSGRFVPSIRTARDG